MIYTICTQCNAKMIQRDPGGAKYSIMQSKYFFGNAM